MHANLSEDQHDAAIELELCHVFIRPQKRPVSRYLDMSHEPLPFSKRAWQRCCHWQGLSAFQGGPKVDFLNMVDITGHHWFWKVNVLHLGILIT